MIGRRINGVWVAVTFCLTMLFSVVAVSAAPVTGGGWTVQASNVYKTTPTPGEWWIDQAPLEVSANIFGSGLSGLFQDGKIDWKGNDLVNDYSAGQIAKGEFGTGGTLIITGTANIYQGFTQVGSSGGNVVLLEGHVNGFQMEETTSNTGNFDVLGDLTVTVTGGFFAAGNNSWLTFPDNAEFNLDVSAVALSAGPTPVSDFSSSMFSTGPMQMAVSNITATPEPSSLILLFGGMGLLVARRRRVAA